ncbi:glutathione S-transferase [Sulfuricaulis limicola]|uniref:Glutathione S-transferase n=1 Tax=Sulfuricaulis limicola TaxID=1620215 RepID=A0A1B4XC72_9GAMM|nr:glutathione S-transferase family protein [Sulfuricaulis limicola]BAV32417.1 glutathione S-transferase [Sulfuricaulis limicola]
MTIRLLTIPISHYCEKARWGLERLGLAYHEEAHIQGFHYWRTWRLSRQPLVPVLIDNGETITGSASILRHLERYARPEHKLYPDPPLRARVDELEVLFDSVLGVESRRWFYFQYRQQPASAILRLIAQRVPAHERLLARWLLWPMQEFARKRLNISLRTVEAGLEQVRQVLAHTDTLLADGRPYLLGDRFTAADLSFACLMAPFTLPRRYGVRLPGPEELPAAMQTTVSSISQSLSGQHAIRLFEEERPVLPPCR